MVLNCDTEAVNSGVRPLGQIAVGLNIYSQGY